MTLTLIDFFGLSFFFKIVRGHLVNDGMLERIHGSGETLWTTVP